MMVAVVGCSDRDRLPVLLLLFCMIAYYAFSRYMMHTVHNFDYLMFILNVHIFGEYFLDFSYIDSAIVIKS